MRTSSRYWLNFFACSARRIYVFSWPAFRGGQSSFRRAQRESSETPSALNWGDDITADVDLDSVVFVDNDIKQLTEFFIALLKRHIGASVPEIRNMTIDNFSKYGLNERIKDPRILAELCHASSAVPRDFINIFRQATIAQRASGSDKMTVANVRSAAYNVYEDKCPHPGQHQSRPT